MADCDATCQGSGENPCYFGCDYCDTCNTGNTGCSACNINSNSCTSCISGLTQTPCSGCNTCQSECQLNRQTPNTSGETFFNNITTPEQFGIINLEEHWSPIFNAVEAIKNYYSNFTYGTKPFASWVKPSFIQYQSIIPASAINDIISNSAITNQTIIEPNKLTNLINNIKNYTLDTKICNSCNTSCNVTCETVEGCAQCDRACLSCNTNCTTSCQSSDISCGHGSCNYCVNGALIW